MTWIAPPGAAAAVAALAVVSLLTGCAAKSGGPAPSPSATKSVAPEPAQPSAVAIEAVLVVASVDVDGKNVTASGYLQGVVTDSGTCVFTFTGAGADFTVEHSATSDRSTTSCGTVQAPIEKFKRGDYSVTVGMDVDGERYTSPATMVAIP